MMLMQLFVMGIFDSINYIIISRKLLEYKKLNKGLCIVSIFFFSLIIAITGKHLPKEYNFIISSLLMLTITYLIYKRNILQTIYLFLLGTIILAFIEFYTVILLEFFTGELGYNFFYGMISQIISLAIVIFINRYLPINNMFYFILKNNKIVKFLILNLFILLIAILFYWYGDVNNILNNIISMSILSIAIVFINLVLLKNGLHEEYNEKQLQIYENYFPVIDELINELRTRQHEYDNHIQALKMIIMLNTDYESMIESVRKYTNELEMENDLGKLIKLDKKVLAGFLYSKTKVAKELNIDFEILIKGYDFSPRLMDFELIEVIGNLINNTFETGVKNNIVKLILSKNKDINVIEVINKHSYLNYETIKSMFKKGFSTKSNSNRGYGLYNIK